jgi:branched-chain amino acid transport system permease protein
MRTAIVSAAVAAIVMAILFAGAGDDLGPNAFVVIGISQGAVYGLVALGLVLVYKGARVFNFAQGEFGTIAAYITFVLAQQMANPLPYMLAAFLAVVGTLLIGLAMERTVVKPLMNRPRITLLVATIAFALLAVGAELVIFNPEPKALNPMVTSLFGKETFTFFNFNIEPQRILLVLIMAGLAVVLGWFFSRTDLGLAILAISQDSFATRVMGISVDRLSMFIWGTAAVLGAVAGILYVPLAGALTAGIVTTQVLIPSFTGAVIGGMTSLPGAFVGGVIVGLVQSLSNWAAGHYSLGDGLIQDSIKGVPDVAIVLALLIVLLARPQGLLGSEA